MILTYVPSTENNRATAEHAWAAQQVSPGADPGVFDTPWGRIGVAICYDVEFPEICRAAAHAGATILVVPFYTDDRQGFIRV